MGLPDHRIKDFETFQAVTGDPHQIAGLYFYQQLDCLVDLAHRISYDFFMRPHLYTDLGLAEKPGTPPRALGQILAQLHARFGYDEFFPSNPQRDEIFLPVFGRGGSYSTTEEGDFPCLRDALIKAAAAFAEHTFDAGVGFLRPGVQDAVSGFKTYLKGLQGDSIKWSRENALASLTENVAYTILRSHEVAGVFSIVVPPIGDWPYAEDTNGDKLIESISQQLKWVDRPNAHAVTRDQIHNKQRVALRGAEAIATIIDFREAVSDYREQADNRDLDLLISKCYTWGAALLSATFTPKTPQPTATEAPNGRAMAALAASARRRLGSPGTSLSPLYTQPYKSSIGVGPSS